MFGLGLPELLVIFGILVLVLGGKRLKESMGGLGQGVRAFKEAVHEPPEPPKAGSPAEKK